MSTINTATNRSVNLSLRMSPDIHQRLNALSERFGVKSSTLISVALGEYLTKHEQAMNATSSMQNAMVEAMAKQFGEIFSGPLGDKVQKDLLQELDNND